MERKNNKAQITIYIIIGIVILTSVLVVLYIRSQAVSAPIEQSAEEIVKNVPSDLMTVYSYVDSCILTTSIDGLKLIGEHGGYIDPIASGKRLGTTSTEGNAVDLITGTDMIIPYWYYLDSQNDCTGDCKFSFGYPNLRKSEGEPSVERMLEVYIDKNIGTCLADFKAIQEQGIKISDMKNYKSKVTVTEMTVVVNLDYTLSASTNSNTYGFNKFSTEVPLNLAKIYQLARQLTDYEAQYNYLEKHDANLIVAYSGLDKDIPPLADVTFQFGSETTWQKDEIEQALGNIFESNIPLFQVQNTANYQQRVMYSRTLDALYNRGTNIPNELDTSSMNVYFSYFQPPSGWDMYFDINCKGGVCRPMSLSSNLVALMGIQRYKFFYDVSHPVLVEINSPQELVNFIPNGYRFKFFLESNLRDNAPLMKDYEKLTQVDVGSTMLCDPDKRNSGDVTITVNGFDGEPISDVSVAYTCGEESCTIGNTGAEGKLVSKFPVCVGGVVSFLKTDYIQYSLPMTIGLSETKKLSISLGQNKDKKISLAKKMIVKSGDSWTLSSTPKPLEQNEEAYIIFEKIGNPTEPPYSAVVTLSGSAPEDTISLGPGTYKVTSNIVLNEPVMIPDSVRNGVEIKGTTMEQPLTGGLNINITITDEDLKKDKITLIALGIDVRNFKTMLDLESLALINDYSTRYKDDIKPIFS